MDDGFLAVGVGDVLAQHADAARLDHVGMDAVTPQELDEGGVEHQRPCQGGEEHLVAAAVHPAVIEGFDQHGQLFVLALRRGGT